ncbi:hypothetical protein J0A65_02460 [Bowmanella sp. Y57]|uniref:DUF4157 domain-containing protein n=2 Tax=Bowmanella yangjiangensis TaxID=2811230 RepID=A0ABS3CNL6_9ALTE|nr:hypothetical protein [Bowmanella yangjiangensis]
MIEKIEQWIHQTNRAHSAKRQSCILFREQFKGFYSPSFLQNAYFVVTDNIPKPDFPELRDAGLDDFLDMEVDGMTYGNTYYVKQEYEEDLVLHFHELVHVLQWQQLTVPRFIARYMQEVQAFGYRKAPLEDMAFSLEDRFKAGESSFDIAGYVSSHL